MGLLFSSVKKYFDKRQKRILMAGLSNAGKSTILNKLLLGDITTTTPAPGFYVEEVEDDNFCFTVCHYEVKEEMGSIREQYYENIEGVIFVVDASDRGKLFQAKIDLHNMLRDEKLEAAVLLIYANKQDLPNAMTAAEITKEMQLNLITNRRWDIIPTIAIQGVGLYEGLEWFAYEIA